MILICQECGKEMEAQKSNKKYCSRKCSNKACHRRKVNNDTNKMEKHCIICGAEFKIRNIAANGRQYCYDCLPEGKTATRTVYNELIKKKYGGKCIICGYNKCMHALEFHHLDPDQKEGIVSNSNGTVEKSLIEAEKCILVCSNCHREIHAGVTSVDKEEVMS